MADETIEADEKVADERAATELERRRAHRAEVREREHRSVSPLLGNIIATAGLPKVWMRVLRVAGPVLLDAGSELAAALHPDSPGGPGITKAELDGIAKGAGDALKAALVKEFIRG